MLKGEDRATALATHDASALIAGAVAGNVSLFDLIRSAPDGDYLAHVKVMRLNFLIFSDVRAAGALLRELQQKIAAHTDAKDGHEAIDKQVARKDGLRRFNKLMSQRAEAFGGSPSLLSGLDFETCLSQYLSLLTHVERLWDSAAREFVGGNFPIAAFLSILVIEEIGKLGRLPQDLVNYDVPRGPITNDGVDRNHRRKHFIGVVSGALINARLDRILGNDVVKKLLHEAESDELEKTRQACLYIDVKNGTPITPGDQISDNRARTLVVLAGELMAEVLGHFPWEFERMLAAVMKFEESIGITPNRISQQ